MVIQLLSYNFCLILKKNYSRQPLINQQNSAKKNFQLPLLKKSNSSQEKKECPNYIGYPGNDSRMSWYASAEADINEMHVV